MIIRDSQGRATNFSAFRWENNQWKDRTEDLLKILLNPIAEDFYVYNLDFFLECVRTYINDDIIINADGTSKIMEWGLEYTYY